LVSTGFFGSTVVFLTSSTFLGGTLGLSSLRVVSLLLGLDEDSSSPLSSELDVPEELSTSFTNLGTLIVAFL
jgi:hypothetical protein